MPEHSLREFLDQLALDGTEPTILDDGGAVVQLSPGGKGLVGLDLDTGKPVKVERRYKTAAEKPTIINAGGVQTVIPPKPPPPPPPASPGRLAIPRARRRMVDT